MKGKEQRIRGGLVVGFVAEEKPAEKPKAEEEPKKRIRKTKGESE